jgi:hypothetical protein
MGLRVELTCDVPGCEERTTMGADFGSFGDGRSGWVDDSWQLPKPWSRAQGCGEAEFDDHSDLGFRCPRHEAVPMGVTAPTEPAWLKHAQSVPMRDWLLQLPEDVLFDPMLPVEAQLLSEQGASLSEESLARLTARVRLHRRRCEQSGRPYREFARKQVVAALGTSLADLVLPE